MKIKICYKSLQYYKVEVLLGYIVHTQIITPNHCFVTQRLNICANMHQKEMQLQSDSCTMEPITMIFTYLWQCYGTLLRQLTSPLYEWYRLP